MNKIQVNKNIRSLFGLKKKEKKIEKVHTYK